MFSPRAPGLVLRPEHDEWDFLAANAGLFDAVLIPEGYLAEYPRGHSLQGKDHQRLLKAAKDTRRPLWRDPETPGLTSRTLLSLPPSDRRLLTPAARALRTGLLTPSALLETSFFEHFVDSCLEAQADAAVLAAPYLDFVSADDLRLRLNLGMLRRAVSAAGEAPVSAFLQVTEHRLLRGLGAEVAPLYAATGVRQVVTRIRGLDAQKASRPALAAYLDAIEAFRERDVNVVADCSGRLGPVLVAGGAAGFSTGTRFYKKVPYSLLAKRVGGGGGEAIAVQAPGSWSEVPRAPEVTAGETRVANLETLRQHMQLAASNPEALIASLRGSEAGYARAWAVELDERRRRRAA